MSDFAVNDLVVIVKQPNDNQPNAHIVMRGLAGYIEEIIGEYAQFVELREDGCGGSGSVPLANLKLANDDIRLQNLKLAKEQETKRMWEKHNALSKMYQDKLYAAINRAVTYTGISEGSVKKIFDICQEFVDDWECSRRS